MWCQVDNITESMGYSWLVTNNCICYDNDADDRMETVIAIITTISWKMLLGQQINGTETESGTWNWMTDGNVHTKPRMCGNVNVAAISLDHEAWLKEDFDTKRCCPEFLRGKKLADRLFWNPRVADKILEIPVSLWRPIWSRLYP